MMGGTDLVLKQLPRHPRRMRFEISSQTTSVLRLPSALAPRPLDATETHGLRDMSPAGLYGPSKNLRTAPVREAVGS